MVIIFKEDWSEVPSTFTCRGEKKPLHLWIMKEKNKYKDPERGIPETGKKRRGLVIQRNLLPVCLTAYSQVINTLEAFLRM